MFAVEASFGLTTSNILDYYVIFRPYSYAALRSEVDGWIEQSHKTIDVSGLKPTEGACVPDPHTNTDLFNLDL